MLKHYSFVLLALTSGSACAQSYCSPIFANGCFNWRSLSILAGSIDWAPGSDDCSVSDYTYLHTTVDAGYSIPMQVSNGNWCGCAVWVDLDNSSSFEESENLYYSYVGGSPSYEYSFNVTIPATTPTGSYRMRLISPWGSDGFLTSNGNGYGPCGDFQYGNFNDFTVNVIGAQSVGEATAADLFTLAPNPASGYTVVSAADRLDRVTVFDVQGRVVEDHQLQGDRMVLGTDAWAKGVYSVRVQSATGTTAKRLIVD